MMKGFGIVKFTVLSSDDGSGGQHPGESASMMDVPVPVVSSENERISSAFPVSLVV